VIRESNNNAGGRRGSMENEPLLSRSNFCKRNASHFFPKGGKKRRMHKGPMININHGGGGGCCGEKKKCISFHSVPGGGQREKRDSPRSCGAKKLQFSIDQKE